MAKILNDDNDSNKQSVNDFKISAQPIEDIGQIDSNSLAHMSFDNRMQGDKYKKKSFTPVLS